MVSCGVTRRVTGSDTDPRVAESAGVNTAISECWPGVNVEMNLAMP
jgi:hypothetical protein